jgi:hypothetical protein
MITDLKNWGEVIVVDRVRDFCSRHGIEQEAQAALEMAQRHFPDSAISARIESDPESEAEWLVLDMEVSEKSAVLESYDRLIQEWVSSASISASSRDHFCFTFHLV